MNRIFRALGIVLVLAGAGAVVYIVVVRSENHSGARVDRQPLTSLIIGPVTPFSWPAQVRPLVGEGVKGLADGPLANARFADPFGVAVDHSGNILIADGGNNNRIRKVTPTGVVTTLAGDKEGFADGTSGAAFNTPSGLAVDDAGNVFVADTGNNAIRKITPQGVVTTIAGDGTAGYRDGAASQAQLNGPIGIAVDQNENVYVADTYNDRIRKISSSGQVTTLAGGNGPGYQDGLAANALFNTPCALVVDGKGTLYIADTRNNAIRTLTADGQVSTLVQAQPGADWRRPVGLALTSDGYLYVGEMGHGRIMQVSPAGEVRGLTGVGIDFPVGDDTALRLMQPVGIALDKEGALLVSDASRLAVRKVAPQSSNPSVPLVAVKAASTADAATEQHAPFPWPFKPQNQAHEIVGTMGEVRGNNDGDSRDHFHAGLDMQAGMGTSVLAVADGKITDPLPAWGYGELTEGISIGDISYIHMRVGRNGKDEPIDPARFSITITADGKSLVRVKRGSRFAVGDVLGTVNRMYHVHLEYSEAGARLNPLVLGFGGLSDHVKPKIESIQLFDQDGHSLAQKKNGQLVVPHDVGALSLVVGAYDQADGNEARRRLGLYQLGFQILNAKGKPVDGYEKPQMNIEFNQLPPDAESVKLAYAPGSGETVHGSAATRFLYVVTNSVRDGHARAGSWQPTSLPSGAYIIRIYASDYAGNVADKNRDLPMIVE